MNRKAQLSIETMIIYGLVLLVAISVVGALLYFNVLDLGSYLPDTCNIGGSGDLKCEEMKLSSTSSSLELGIRNVGKRPIEYLRVTVSDDDAIHFSGAKSADAKDKTDADISDTNSLPPGDIAKVSIDVGSGVLASKALKGTLKTEYMFKEGVVTQEASGTVRIKAT